MTGPVTAAVATTSGSVIVAGLYAEIQRYVSPTGGVETVQRPRIPDSPAARSVLALATDDLGICVVSLVGPWAEDVPYRLRVSSKKSRGDYRHTTTVGLHGDAAGDVPYLQPDIFSTNSSLNARVWDRTASQTFEMPNPKSPDRVAAFDAGDTTFFAVCGDEVGWSWGRMFLRCRQYVSGQRVSYSMPWDPGFVTTSHLTQQPVSWITPTPSTLELSGVDDRGSVHWSRVESGRISISGDHGSGTCVEGYAVSCVVAPSQIVAVTAAGHVVKLRAAAGGNLARGETVAQIAHPSRPVFAAYQPAVGEVVVVFSDGVMARVKI